LHCGVRETVTALGVVAVGAGRANLRDWVGGGEYQGEGKHGNVVQKSLV